MRTTPAYSRLRYPNNVCHVKVKYKIWLWHCVYLCEHRQKKLSLRPGLIWEIGEWRAWARVCVCLCVRCDADDERVKATLKRGFVWREISRHGEVQILAVRSDPGRGSRIGAASRWSTGRVPTRWIDSLSCTCAVQRRRLNVNVERARTDPFFRGLVRSAGGSTRRGNARSKSHLRRSPVLPPRAPPRALTARARSHLRVLLSGLQRSPLASSSYSFAVFLL